MGKTKEVAGHKTKWTLEKFKDDEALKAGKAFETKIINDNILVNAGINALTTLLAGGGGNPFDNSNAYLGVGDDDTAAADSQTDLIGSNKVRVAMNATYPTYGTSQKITFKSDFGSAVANFNWKEYAVFNASSGGTMLNRKVDDQGTKTAGQTWRLTLEITFS